jgi:hypothetical protein
MKTQPPLRTSTSTSPKTKLSCLSTLPVAAEVTVTVHGCLGADLVSIGAPLPHSTLVAGPCDHGVTTTLGPSRSSTKKTDGGGKNPQATHPARQRHTSTMAVTRRRLIAPSPTGQANGPGHVWH